VEAAPPAWSPDGRTLVVASSGVALIDVATGSITPLSAEPGSALTWSIDGMLAFSTTGSAAPGVMVIDSDGSNVRRVLADLAFVSVLQWSPDGGRLLFGDDNGESLVAVADPGSGNLTLLVNDFGGTRSPAWQPRLP
jgi:Tol biopolymer transport system component